MSVFPVFGSYAGGSGNCYSQLGKAFRRFPVKLNVRLGFDTATPRLFIDPREVKTCPRRLARACA